MWSLIGTTSGSGLYIGGDDFGLTSSTVNATGTVTASNGGSIAIASLLREYISGTVTLGGGSISAKVATLDGRLQGSGTVTVTGTGPLSLSYSGTIRGGIAGGSSSKQIGTLSVSGSVQLTADATLEVGASRMGAGQANASLIRLINGGTFDLSGAVGNSRLHVVIDGATLVGSETYMLNLVDAGSGSVTRKGQTLTLDTNNRYTFAPADYDVSIINGTTGVSAATLSYDGSTQGLYVAVTTTPEPAGVMALCGTALALGALLRRGRSAIDGLAA